MKNKVKRILLLFASIVLLVSSVPIVPVAAASSGVYVGPTSYILSGNASVKKPVFTYTLTAGEEMYFSVSATSDYQLVATEIIAWGPNSKRVFEYSVREKPGDYHRYKSRAFTPTAAGEYSVCVSVETSKKEVLYFSYSFTVKMGNAKSPQTSKTSQTSKSSQTSVSVPTVYRQNDSRWSTYPFPADDDPKATVSGNACGVFAFVNCVSYLTGKQFSVLDIEDICQYTIDNGYRCRKQLADSKRAKKLGVSHIDTLTYINTVQNKTVIEKMNRYLNNGCALYFSVFAKDSNGKEIGHIMSIIGIRTVKGVTQYRVADSYPLAERLGSGVSLGWCTMDSALDLHPIDNPDAKIVTKGGDANSTNYGFWVLSAN